LIRLFLVFIFTIQLAISQEIKKEMQAVRINETVSIDGYLSESVWSKALPAKDFISFRPDNLNPIPENLKTEVKIIYDDEAIYIGAKMYDSSPNLIMKEITQRDNTGASDFFGAYINGFNDGQGAFGFFVTAAGTQNDVAITDANGEDGTWDAIWLSKVKIVEDGWIVEMKIPYAALRFIAEKEQTWGINFMREVRRDRQSYTWNPIDVGVGGFNRQAGLLKGITEIKPPTRLFFIPYISTYLAAAENMKPEKTVKGGLDIKYGINDALTLDAILIPDFGQAAFDNVVLNLGPFEQQFNENRPFFQEGTDLFNKGNIFYSRRIGEGPNRALNLANNEEVEKYPSTTELLNATKISGRTSKGLGVGFLNAITDNNYALIRNTDNQTTRRELVAPVTNYNITVLDQRFNQNSSISLINSNVTRMSVGYEKANVTGLVFDLFNKENSYNLFGSAKYSSIYGTENGKKGFSGDATIARTKGKYRFSGSIAHVSKDYDINDLGINFITNFTNFDAAGSYQILNPTKYFNQFFLRFNAYVQLENTAVKPMFSGINLTTNFSSKKNDWFGGGIWTTPTEYYDFYEPRVQGRFLIQPKHHGGNVWFSTNYNRKFAGDFRISFNNFEQVRRQSLFFNISPRYRFNDSFTLVYSFNYQKQWSDMGYTAMEGNNIVLIERDRDTFTNTISGKYAINADMTFNLSVRHYWALSEKVAFHTLQENGRWTPNSTFNNNRNDNFNLWNFDLSYSWWFVPGSQLNFLYRNNAFSSTREIDRNFGNNISNLFEDNLNHTFSLSIRYFLDYNQAKGWVKKA
jgi:hypothetical protein